jgi:hypothetical protein
MNKELRRIAILVLAMTLTVVFSVPAMAAENTGKDAVSFSDLLNNDSGETVKTKIKGSQKTIRVLKYGTAKPLDKIRQAYGVESKTSSLAEIKPIVPDTDNADTGIIGHIL